MFTSIESEISVAMIDGNDHQAEGRPEASLLNMVIGESLLTTNPALAVVQSIAKLRITDIHRTISASV